MNSPQNPETLAKPSLRLMAEDAEDLRILSIYLQDAVIRVGDIAWLPRAQRFAVLLNRYLWESDCSDEDAPCARVRAGLHFDGVLRAQSTNLRRDDPEAVIELLAMDFTPGEDGTGVVDLWLAGGGGIRLEVEYIGAALRDISEPWPAKARPVHDLEQG